MFAIVKIGGSQFKVSPEDKIKVDKLNVAVGGEVIVKDVLLVSDGDKTQVGDPHVPYHVNLEVVEHDRHPKVTSVHFKRRGGRRKTQGHRQHYSLVKVKSIEKGD